MANEKQARDKFLKRKEKLAATEKAAGTNSLKKGQTRLIELDRLLTSIYEDKVLGKIPQETCINLLNKYPKEKNFLKANV